MNPSEGILVFTHSLRHQKSGSGLNMSSVHSWLAEELKMGVHL